MQKLLAVVLVILLAPFCSAQTFGINTTPVVNQTYSFGPDHLHAFKIATLAPSQWAAAYDHLHIIATANTNWLSCCNAGADITFANRGGLTYFYTVHGAPMAPAAKIVVYANPDSTADVYFLLGPGYVTGSYTVIENLQENVLSNPPDEGLTLRTDAPIFDSSSATTPPQQFIGANGNLGFETQFPGAELSIVTGNPGSETGEHILNTSMDGYSVIRLGTDAIYEGGSAWHQFNSQWAFDPNSAYAPSSTAIAAFEQGGLAIATTKAAPIRFFTSGAAGDSERMRLDAVGRLGVGTASPSEKLEIAGNIKLSGASAGIIFPDGSIQTKAFTQTNGSTVLGGNLHVAGNIPQDTSSQGAYLGWNSLTGSTGETDFINNQGGGPGGFAFFNTPSSGAPRSLLMFINGAGNLGIGTATPSAKLDVNGIIHAQGLQFPNGVVQTAPFDPTQAPSGASQLSGNLSIATTQPVGLLTIASSQPDGQGDAAHGLVFADTTLGINNQWAHAAIYTDGSYYWNGNLVFATDGDSMRNNNLTEKMRLTYDGHLGLGTSKPGKNLIVAGQPFIPSGPVFEINGTVALSSNKGGSIIFSDGTVQSTAYTGTCIATGGDYAESVDIAGLKSEYEPGDVLVIGVTNLADITKSNEPYSTMVAGVYSTKPGYVGRRQKGDPKLSTTSVPMAMIGIVPTKVTTENGPIHRGDLLVTSSLPGYAMRGTEQGRMLGAVLDKALGSLDQGTGVVEVLVTLQ